MLVLGALCAMLALALGVRPVRASYEEFASLDVARSELDDENLLDHVLVRPPEAWLREWDRSTGGFRSSQGCFTAGQWHMDNLFRLRAPMGDTTRMDVEVRQMFEDEARYEWTQLDLRFPLPSLGLWGIRFRPTYDKSQQDAALLWDLGWTSTPVHVRAVMGLEDVFNNFWSSRQTKVGDEAAPYEHHPFEPELRFEWRGDGSRLSWGGKWLTPSVRRFDTRDPNLRRRERLWGAKQDGALDVRSPWGTVHLEGEMVQASSWAEWQAIPGDHHVFRRRWRVEGALSRPLGQRGEVTAHFFYQERGQSWAPPIAEASIAAIDRMPMLEVAFPLPHDVGARIGFMRDRVTVAQDGFMPGFTWGTRVETRAFLSLQHRFGRVLLQGTEGIELDREPYDVAFIHDKGFVQIQTTF